MESTKRLVRSAVARGVAAANVAAPVAPVAGQLARLVGVFSSIAEANTEVLKSLRAEALKAEQLDLFGGPPTPVGPKSKPTGVPRQGLHAEIVQVGGAHPHQQTVWKAEPKPAQAPSVISHAEKKDHASMAKFVSAHVEPATAAWLRDRTLTAAQKKKFWFETGTMQAADAHAKAAASGLKTDSDEAHAMTRGLRGDFADRLKRRASLHEEANFHEAEAERLEPSGDYHDHPGGDQITARGPNVAHARHHHAISGQLRAAAETPHDDVDGRHDRALKSAAEWKRMLKKLAPPVEAGEKPAAQEDHYDKEILDKRHPLHELFVHSNEKHGTRGHQHSEAMYKHPTAEGRAMHTEAAYAHMDAQAAFSELQNADHKTAPGLIATAKAEGERADAASARANQHAPFKYSPVED